MIIIVGLLLFEPARTSLLGSGNLLAILRSQSGQLQLEKCEPRSSRRSNWIAQVDELAFRSRVRRSADH